VPRTQSEVCSQSELAAFLREQEVMQELIDRSLLPKFVVDVTENTLEQNATRVADWLEATGGLTAPEESDFFPRGR
jgi:hypothetical protein